MKFFLFNHQSEHKSDGNVFKVTRNSSSVRREIFLLVVKALHCSGCQACRGAHFPIVDSIGLALHLALLDCQGSCGIAPNGPTSLHLGSFKYVRA